MTDQAGAPPLIDISALVADHDEPTPSAVPGTIVAAIDDACRSSGFFVAVGHGLDHEMAAVFDQARAFFDQPQATKEATPRVNRYGFVPQAAQAIDRERTSGNTEFLDMGLADEVALPALPGFEQAVRDYQPAALRVAAVLLRALAQALSAPGDFFAERMRDPQCRLRMLHYPAVEPLPDGTLPVPTEPHTDYGAITLLATDGVPGLEVKPIGGEWTPVAAPAGSLVVNLGDMLARWTNDRYRSTPHRVVGPAEGDRISIPFFINPDPATIVETIDVCVTDDAPSHYEPIRAGDFLAQRIDSRAEPYVDRSEGPARRATAPTS